MRVSEARLASVSKLGSRRSTLVSGLAASAASASRLPDGSFASLSGDGCAGGVARLGKLRRDDQALWATMPTSTRPPETANPI